MYDKLVCVRKKKGCLYMNRYYLIPVTSKSVKVDKLSLFDVLQKADSELSSREEFRKVITYELEESKVLKENGVIASYNEETSRMYRERGIPERIVLVSNEEGVREIQTGVPISCNNSSFLDVFSVTPEQVVELFKDNRYYSASVERFLGCIPNIPSKKMVYADKKPSN